MKNRIFAALLALAIGAPLYLLSAHAAPRQTSPAAPAALTAVLKAVPHGALRLTAALAPEDNALAEWQAQVQQEAERQQRPRRGGGGRGKTCSAPALRPRVRAVSRRQLDAGHGLPGGDA